MSDTLKQKSSENSFRQSFSPWLRFRILAANRIKEYSDVFNANYFADVLHQSKTVTEDKNKLAKSLAILMFAAYAVLSNQSIVLPFTQTSLDEIPFVIEILLVLASVTYFLFSIKFADEQCYNAAIDGYINQHIHDDLLTSHLYRMSLKDESSLFTALTGKYRFIEDERELLPGRRAKFYSGVLLLFNVILLVLLVLLPAIFLGYWSWQEIDGNLSGMVVRTVSFMCCLTALLNMSLIPISFPHTTHFDQ